MKKRFLLILLAVVCVTVFLMAVPASAAEASGSCGENLTWVLNDGVLTISGSGPMEDWENGNPTPWCDYMDDIKKVVIGEGVTTVGARAFMLCSNLKTLTLPSTLKSIGDDAFYYCSQIMELEISDAVTSIGACAFSCCESLRSVQLPDALQVLNYDAFSNCFNLTKVTIPENVEDFSLGVFGQCEKLSLIEFKGDAPTFNSAAFVGTDATIVYPAGNRTWTDSVRQDYGGDVYWFASDSLNGQGTFGRNNLKWSLQDGTLTISGEGEMSGLSDPAPWYPYRGVIKKVVITDSITNIGSSAFAKCSNLTTAKLTDDITWTADGVFEGCVNLKSVNMPSALYRIGEHAFRDCYSLETVTFPMGLTEIYQYAFENCYALKSVYFTGNPPKMHRNVITESVTTIYYPKGNSAWSQSQIEEYKESSVADGVKFEAYNVAGEDATGITGVCGSKLTWVFEDGVLTISGSGAMNDFLYSIPDPWEDFRKDIEKVMLPDGLTSIGFAAFADCTSLTEIDIPNGVSLIGKQAFRYCSALESVIVPEGVTTIEELAFDHCTSLKSVKLPDSLKSIGMHAFGYCTSLKSVTIPAHVDAIYMGAFENCTSLKEVWFTGDCPEWIDMIFTNVTATVYYPAGNETWTKAKMDSTEGNITWVAHSPIDITTQPKTQKVKAGGTVKYTVKASGEGLKYQWQSSSDGKKWKNCSSTSAKKVTFTFTAKTSHSSNYYRCVITDADGNKITTKEVRLYVLGITEQPTTKKVEAGEKVKFTVKATGAGKTYQWQSSSDGKTWKNCTSSSAKSATFTFTGKTSHSGNYYRCKVTDNAGNVVYTSAVRLYVLGVKTQPKAQTVKSGEKVKFTVKATGAGKTYQWQCSTDGGKTWKNCSSSSATSATFTFTGKTKHNGNYYRCKISDNAGNVVYTNKVKLTLKK